MKMKRKTDIKDEIKEERLLAEVCTKSYEYIQLRRIEYWKGRNPYIDVRAFQTSYYEEPEPEPRHPTKRGIRMKETTFLELVGSAGLLPPQWLHFSLRRAHSKLTRGEVEDAVFEAFKQVEMSVRRACGYGSHPVGVKLMRKAFDPETGPLADSSRPIAEREAEAHVFSGAIGAYKNPGSHRSVRIDHEDGCRLLVFAGFLLSTVDGRKVQPPSM